MSYKSKFWQTERDSNRRKLPRQGSALAAMLYAHMLESRTGVEPAIWVCNPAHNRFANAM